MSKERIPQNIQALIGEIGERLVLFKLYELTHKKKHLEVFKNYSDKGYDVGIRNNKTGEKVKIEVKTRQREVTTAKVKNKVHFMLTEIERNNADFLVGYWLEHNDYFIIPIRELDSMGAGTYKDGKKKTVYKHIVTRYKKNDNYSEKSQKWINERGWKLILEFVNSKKAR